MTPQGPDPVVVAPYDVETLKRWLEGGPLDGPLPQVTALA